MTMIDATANAIENEWNTWTKNEKIKTCKCDVCGNRVDAWSYQCSKCRRHVCSHCLTSSSRSTTYQRKKAEWYITKRCFCMSRRKGYMDPEFREIYGDQAPPKRIEEDQRARQSRGLTMSNTKSKAKAAGTPKARNLDEDRPESDDEIAPDINHESSTGLTLAATKPRRQGIKRKTYYEEDPDDGVVSQSEQDMPSKRSRIRYGAPPGEGDSNVGGGLTALLDGETTVVVGAGIIGLFIARELALKAKQAGIKHHIVVIEFKSSYCRLASGHCAGFLSTNGMPEDWNEIATDAKEWWFEQFASAEGQARLEFNANTRYQVVEGEANDGDVVPHWLREKVSWSLAEDEHSIGRINPMSLASWAYEQCTTLGIEFYFEHKVANVDFAAYTGVSGVQICDVSDDDTVIDMACSNLVFAAGAFTTGLSETLFAKAPLKLENHLQGSDWFVVRSVQADFTKSAAFRFPSAAKSEERLGDEICVVIDIEQNTIAISGTVAHIRDKPLNTSLVKDPSHGKVSELQRLAAKCFNTTSFNVLDKITAGRRHRWELSVANGMRPVIDGVHKSKAGLSSADAATESQIPHGVWLCYGFGNYGTVLAPGVAKTLLARMGNNQEGVSADVDAFRLPIQPPSQDTELPGVEGKGKGKAKVI